MSMIFSPFLSQSRGVTWMDKFMEAAIAEARQGLHECRQLMEEFIRENPGVWYEDIGTTPRDR
jgi:hypothetical protein